MIRKATATAIATATPCPRVLPRVPLRTEASAGSPSAPMPIEVSVTPICTAEMYSLMFPSCSSASPAPFMRCSRMISRRALRERTSAYSAITKNALIATRTAVKMSFRPFTPARRPATRHGTRRGCPSRDDGSGGGPLGPSYLGVDLLRRSSVADPSKVARAMVGRATPAPARSGELVDPAGELEVGGGEAALRVGAERQAHLVPAVQEDVRVVVGGLCGVGYAVHEGDRGGEVGELELAGDRLEIGPAPAVEALQAIVDLRVVEGWHPLETSAAGVGPKVRSCAS